MGSVDVAVLLRRGQRSGPSSFAILSGEAAVVAGGLNATVGSGTVIGALAADEDLRGVTVTALTLLHALALD